MQTAFLYSHHRHYIIINKKWEESIILQRNLTRNIAFFYCYRFQGERIMHWIKRYIYLNVFLGAISYRISNQPLTDLSFSLSFSLSLSLSLSLSSSLSLSLTLSLSLSLTLSLSESPSLSLSLALSLSLSLSFSLKLRQLALSLQLSLLLSL